MTVAVDVDVLPTVIVEPSSFTVSIPIFVNVVPPATRPSDEYNDITPSTRTPCIPLFFKVVNKSAIVEFDVKVVIVDMTFFWLS